MSTEYKDAADVPTMILVERLGVLSDAVAKNSLGEFDMRVPVEVDRDADVVLLEAAKRLATLTAERKQVRELVKAVEAINPLHLTHSVQAGHELKTETGSFDGGRSPFKHLDEARSLATQLKEQLCRTQSN